MKLKKKFKKYNKEQGMQIHVSHQDDVKSTQNFWRNSYEN